jgi:hypothetical protein
MRDIDENQWNQQQQSAITSSSSPIISNELFQQLPRAKYQKSEAYPQQQQQQQFPIDTGIPPLHHLITPYPPISSTLNHHPLHHLQNGFESNSEAEQTRVRKKRYSDASSPMSSPEISLSPPSNKRSRITPIHIYSNQNSIPHTVGSSVIDSPHVSLSPLSLVTSPFGPNSYSVTYEQRAEYLRMLHIQRVARQRMQQSLHMNNQSTVHTNQHASTPFPTSRNTPPTPSQHRFYHTSFLEES